MANYSTDGTKSDNSQLIGKKGDGNGQNNLAQLFEKAQMQLSAKASERLVINPFVGQSNLTSSTTNPFVLVMPSAKDLIEAREYIDKKQYAAALIPLKRAVKAFPAPPEKLLCEANYLLSFCLFQLEQPENALEALGAFIKIKLNEPWLAKVKELRAEIRKKMMLQVLIDSLIHMQTNQNDLAISKLTHIVQLDPECGMYHFILAAILLNVDRIDEAEITVTKGLNYCEDDSERQLLANIKEQIDRRVVEGKLKPAIDYFRNAKYLDARSTIENMAPKYREDDLCKNFYAYIQLLLSKNNLRQLPKPGGSSADVERLHFLLVGTEIRQATVFINNNQFLAARALLNTAIKYTPYFPYANYLLALCMYRSVSDGSISNNSEAVDMLETAANYAKIAATDSEIKGAQVMIAAIELQSIITTANKGIDSISQIANLVNRLKTLNTTLASLKANTSDSDTLSSIANLNAGIARNLVILANLLG